MMLALLLAAAFAAAPSPLETARDAQDRAALQKLADQALAAAAGAPSNAGAQLRAAQACSYLAGVAIELHDRKAARAAAERGIPAAEKAVALKPDAESLRVAGTLYGQAVADLLSGLKYGAKAKDAIDRAVAQAPKSSAAMLAHGVGMLYLPAQLGGGPKVAMPDFRKAIELDPSNAEAYLFLGICLREQNQNAEAHQAIAKSLELNPRRVWAKQQLDKTPPK